MLGTEFVVRTADAIDLPLKRFTPSGPRPTRSVLMLHGASASSDTFLTPNGGITKYLLERGIEVWLLDWRGSKLVVDQYGPEHTPRFTFDHVAELDIPAALTHIRRVSPCRQLSIFAHCIGATCVSMAVQRGLLAPFSVEEYVLSTVGLFFRAPLESFLKAEDGILERVSAEAPSCTGIDPNRPEEWPDAMRRAYAAWPAVLLPQGSAPADEVYRRASFMFGAPYQRALVPDEVHARVGSLFGRIRLPLFMHAGQCLRRGYAAPFDAAEHGPRAVAERGRHLDASAFDGTRVTLITGRSNQLWHRESIDEMYEWLRNETRGQHRKHVLPRYGHQDLLWGVDAPRDVYPLILDGLTARSRATAAMPVALESFARSPALSAAG